MDVKASNGPSSRILYKHWPHFYRQQRSTTERWLGHDHHILTKSHSIGRPVLSQQVTLNHGAGRSTEKTAGRPTSTIRDINIRKFGRLPGASPHFTHCTDTKFMELNVLVWI